MRKSILAHKPNKMIFFTVTLELKIGPLESEKIIIGFLESEEIVSLQVHTR